MIEQTKDGKFKVKGYDELFDNGVNAVTFARNMLTQKRKESLATKGVYGPTSFDELDEYRVAAEKADQMYWLVSDFMYLVDNAVYDDETKDIGQTIRQLANEFATRADGIATDDSSAAEVKEKSFSEKVMDVVRELFAGKSKQEEKGINHVVDIPNGRLMFYKSGEHTKWVATYSNNLIDDDHPREIISADSHKKHVELVKAGLVAPPDLWLWHEPDWNWGTGEWVTYDEQDEVVFTHAGGTVKSGCEELADVISSSDWGVSHGMPKWSVSYDKDNPNVIKEHVTTEVSPLPLWAAANKHTSFSINKEASMIPKQEKARLMKEFGVSEDLLATLEASSQTKAAAAAEEQRLYKETEEVETVEVVEQTAEVEAETQEETVEESANAEPNETSKAAVKEADFVAVIETVTKLADTVNQLAARMDSYDKSVDSAIAEKAAESPIASLLAQLNKAMSPIGNEESVVDGRTKLAKSGPEEASSGYRQTGIQFVDNFLREGGNS